MKIMFSITHGFQARMLLRTNIAKLLLDKGVHLIICSLNADEPYFKKEFAHPHITLVAMPQNISWIEIILSNLRQYLLSSSKNNRTINYKRERLRKDRPVIWFIICFFNQLLGCKKWFREFYEKLEIVLFPGKEFHHLLMVHQPDLIVVGTPGYNVYDVHLLRSAKKIKIATVAAMLSWDNLTSKGYIVTSPDYLLVWSDLMRDEAIEYHDFCAEKIIWCGAAQFDHYFRFRDTFNKESWRNQHRIPAAATLLVYGTINPQILPHEIEILKSIVKAMNEERFGPDVYLWIRLHPQIVKGYYKISTEPFHALAGKRIFVEEPKVRSEKLSWDLPKEDMSELAQLLCAADILITTSSTLVIDAACVDTPIINVFFDGDQKVPPALSSARFQNYTHYAKILNTGGILPVYSIEGLIRQVDTLKKNPKEGNSGRLSILKQQFNQFDGKASQRVVEALINLNSKSLIEEHS